MNRFTIYDMMEKRGDFRRNPANADARDDKGLPIHVKSPYPKMFYHPKGETVVTVRAEAIATPFGPKMVGEQRRLISKIAQDEEEAQALRAEGWHEHPADAIHAGNPELMPDKGPGSKIANLEAANAGLEAEIAKLRAELESKGANSSAAIASGKGGKTTPAHSTE